MNSAAKVALHTWLAGPLSPEVRRSIARLQRADDVVSLAVMPDVHLAEKVCVGTVFATRSLVYPSAVGGDIGCGMAALAFDIEAASLADERLAARVLAGLYQTVPANKHAKPRLLPGGLDAGELSSHRLSRSAERDGRVQLGTLGRGNHFLELQSDGGGRLWVMIHSGSRGVGRAAIEHHLSRAQPHGGGLVALDSRNDAGAAYLADLSWARRYAAENRLAMLRAVAKLLGELCGASADWSTLIHCDHNHVQRELHGGEQLWVHRKGAQSAKQGEAGIVPGSMGTASFHTVGRGVPESLDSCSHGAGRQLTRTDARRSISTRKLAAQLHDVWYDHRRLPALREEAPAAYKDIYRVMRAQRELTKAVRELSPVLTYKGR